ncbi:MAG: menaquinone biosynthesis protein [Candidatus Poseidoniales archaeon]|nr:menaquinone biosynthesis protein [Candidatus Poseidoniales archaeon]
MGRVAFVNCDPLYHDLPPPWEVLPAPPSWLTGHILRKDCLLAPIPTADFAKYSDQLQLLPDICIGSTGTVGSVLLFGDRDPSQMRDIALPTDSATSRKLCMWLLQQMGLNPRPVNMGPDLGQMLDRCDGALLIGDRALDESARHPELIRMDLGQAWLELTGFPMVFAVYAAHRDAPPEMLREAHKLLRTQLESFESSPTVRDSVIRATSTRSGFSEERIEQYFGEVVHRLDSLGEKGLKHFLEEVCALPSYQIVDL